MASLTVGGFENCSETKHGEGSTRLRPCGSAGPGLAAEDPGGSGASGGAGQVSSAPSGTSVSPHLTTRRYSCSSDTYSSFTEQPISLQVEHVLRNVREGQNGRHTRISRG